MRLSILPLVLLLASCLGTMEFGTNVTSEMAAQIHPGMTKAEVRSVLGQPDVKSDNLNDGSVRWTYGHSKVSAGGSKYRQYTVDFTKEGKVVIDGNDGSKRAEPTK